MLNFSSTVKITDELRAYINRKNNPLNKQLSEYKKLKELETELQTATGGSKDMGKILIDMDRNYNFGFTYFLDFDNPLRSNKPVRSYGYADNVDTFTSSDIAKTVKKDVLSLHKGEPIK